MSWRYSINSPVLVGHMTARAGTVLNTALGKQCQARQHVDVCFAKLCGCAEDKHKGVGHAGLRAGLSVEHHLAGIGSQRRRWCVRKGSCHDGFPDG